MYYSWQCGKKAHSSFINSFSVINKRKILDIKKYRKCLELSVDTIYAPSWRGGRVVEGAPLLRE